MCAKRGAKPKKDINKVARVVFYTPLSNIMAIGGFENAREISIKAINAEVNKNK